MDKTSKIRKSIIEFAKHNGIQIRVGKIGDASKQGIHILNPDTNELLEVVDACMRDLFTTIYVHNEETYGKF